MMASKGQRQFLLVLTALVAVGNLLLWGLLGLVYWIIRTGDPYGPDYTPAQLTEHQQLFEVTAALFIANVIGSVAFVIRNRGVGLVVFAAVQIADIAVTIAMRDLHSGLVIPLNPALVAVPAMGLVLLAVLWRYSPRPLKSTKSGPSM